MTITRGQPGHYITRGQPGHYISGRGYYLVLPSGERHWIGATSYDAARAIDKACDKHLRAEDGYEYWIDFCHGYDVHNKFVWANVDQSDIILHRAENM